MLKSLLAPSPAKGTALDSLMLIHMHRAVGAVALALPVLVVLIGATTVGCIPGSISHSYFVPVASDVFAGCLFFIGIAMCFVYHPRLRGAPQYENFTAWDFRLLWFAGLMALLIAIYPTQGSGCLYSGDMARVFLTNTSGSDMLLGGEHSVEGTIKFDLWHRELTNTKADGFDARSFVHNLAAIMMFSVLGYVVLCVFTRIQDPEALGSAEKSMRNRRYFVCAGLIFACIIALIVEFILRRGMNIPTFDPNGFGRFFTLIAEWIALWAFGYAWLVKGRYRRSMRDSGSAANAVMDASAL